MMSVEIKDFIWWTSKCGNWCGCMPIKSFSVHRLKSVMTVKRSTRRWSLDGLYERAQMFRSEILKCSSGIVWTNGGSIPGNKAARAWSSSHFCLVSSLRMGGALPPSPYVMTPCLSPWIMFIWRGHLLCLQEILMLPHRTYQCIKITFQYLI